MAVTDSVNKGRPPLRTWELNATSTRFDHLLAAPSDQALQHYWMAWAGIALFVGVFILVVFLGVISSKTARRHTFNLYLIYLMIPDCLFSLLCGTTCLLNAVAGEYWSHAMCNFQQFYCVWGIGSNTWLNAAITRELHKLLRDSRHRKRYILPGAWQVSKQCLAIYLYTAFIATWGLIESPKFPFYAAAPSGLACIPVEADRRSAFFFWLVFFPLFAGLPTCYVFYACYDVWKHQLLPPTGKRRLLVIYFGRVILVFLSVWVPYFVLLFCFATLVPPSVHFAGGTLAHLQGITSAIVSLMKPDIFLAVKQFVLCRRRCCCGDGGCGSTRTTSRHGGGASGSSSDAFDWRWYGGGGSSFIVSRRHAAAADAARGDGGGVIESKNNGGDGDGGPPQGRMSTLSSLDFEVGGGVGLAATHDDPDNELGLQDLSLHSFAEVGSVVETESYLTSSCSLWPNEDGEYDDDDEASLSPLPNPPATGMTSNSSSRMMTMIPPPLSLVLEESSGSQHCSQRGGGGGSSSSSGSARGQSSIRDDGPSASLSVGSSSYSQRDDDDDSSDGSYHHHHHHPGQTTVMVSDDETSSNSAAASRVVSPDRSQREEDNSLSSSSDTPTGAEDIEGV